MLSNLSPGRWSVLRFMAPVLLALAIGLALLPNGKLAEAAGPLDLCLGPGCSFTSTVFYVDWTSINAGNGTASGAITLPSGPPVSVTLTAVNPDNSNGSFFGGQTGCGANFWNPSAPYISPEVPNAPPNCELVQLQGGQNQTYRLTFSQSVQDPLMAIVSLGSGSNFTTYDFDRPFTIVSQGAGFFGGDATRLVQLPGDILRGNEGHGTIRFIGTFPTFSWTVPTPEVWHGFTFGIRTTTALSGQQVVVNEGNTATNTGRWGGANPTLTASAGTIVKNADGTWNWSFLTNDGPAQDQDVTITATEGASSVSQTFHLSVKNVMPSATLGNNGPKPVGVPITATFTGASDPSSADTLAGFHYAFDCNGGTLAGITYASAGNSASVQCTYATPGPVTITGRIIDKDNGDGHFDHTTSTFVIADVTPPVITPAVTGPLGLNGWYVGNVNVSWTVTDPDSTVTSQTGCDPTAVSTDTAGVTFTCTATSAGGTASQSVTVKRDATAPAATATAAPAPNANGWNNTNVTVTFAGTDGMSGIASCTAPATLGEGAGQSASGTCSDNAGNVSAPASATNINVDKTAPAVSITGVTNGASYVVGAVPNAGCATTDALSGVATNATVSTSGGPVGTVTVTCNGATDKAGNAASVVTATYTVTYQICPARGDNDDDEHDDHGDSRSSGHESGRTIPVKVRVCDAAGRNIGSRSLIVTAVGISPTGSLNDSGRANPGNRFRFDDGKYIFNLSTKGLAPGAYTLDFTIGNDPTVYHYSFTVRPEKRDGDRKDESRDRDEQKNDGKGGKHNR